MLPSGAPTEPSSAEFAEQLAAGGRAFAEAGVAAVYLIHGTFAGNDGLGLFTELERVAPRLAQSCRRAMKRAFNAVVGETGNYTPQFAERMERSLAAGAGRTIPVRLFNWSGMNHHIARADAAVRLVCELAALSESASALPPVPSASWGGLGRGGEAGTSDPIDRSAAASPPAPLLQGEESKETRALLWAHSHGGNALAILTNLLAADEATRNDFFSAAKIFFDGNHAAPSGFTAWPRAERILGDPSNPIRRLQLDIVTFGTPIRYGWDAAGYTKLLHIINHRPHRRDAHHAAPYPPHPVRLLMGTEGDFIQQVGIAGTSFPPLPVAYKTFLANRRLRRMFHRELQRHWIRTRLKHGPRVAEDGTTLLIHYEDPDRLPFRHLFGHAPYTRSRWLPLHARLVAEEFYSRGK